MEVPREPSELDELSPYLSDPVDHAQPLVGRENELDRLIELLCRRTGKNPVLVGEPGVGKRTIVGGLARRIAEGDVPQSLAGKAILGLDLPPVRVLEKQGSWLGKLDRALVAAGQDGTIFFLNRMHDQPGGVSPVASFHVTELLEWPITTGKLQFIGTSTPASFAKLQADGHWPAEYFEAIEVTPANVEDAIKVLGGIKGAYEAFHNVSYANDAIEYAVYCANKYMKNRSLPAAAVEIIDVAGAAAQLHQGSMPKEVVEVQKRIRFIVQRMEACIANHEFEKARFYSQEERKERDNLKQLREKHKVDSNPAWNISREEIEKAVSKLVGNSGDTGSKTD